MVQLIKYVDKYIGSPMCSVYGLFKGSPLLPKNPRSILLIQLWGIGETVLTLPAIKELQKKYPKAKISVLCTARNKEVYHKQGIEVIDLSLNLLKIKWFVLTHINAYDVVIDMEEYLNISALIAYWVGKYRIGYNHGSRKKLYDASVKYNDKQHCSQTFMDLLRPLGIQKKVSSLISVSFDKKDEQSVAKMLKSLKKPIIACSAGAAESARFRMWEQNKWTTLAKKLPGTVVFVGAQDVYDLNEKIIESSEALNLAGKISLKELFALCKKVDLMISIDSGPMHVAAAQGVKTIGLFGPNTPTRFGPLGKNNIAIYKTKYKPVINVHKGQVPTTSRKDFMKDIAVKDVFSAAKELLKKNHAK